MKQLIYRVIEDHEYPLVRRVLPYAGYAQTDQDLRTAEVRTLNILGRRNHPIDPDQFDDILTALANLHARLAAQTSPEALLALWTTDPYATPTATDPEAPDAQSSAPDLASVEDLRGAAERLAEERVRQVHLVTELRDALTKAPVTA